MNKSRFSFSLWAMALLLIGVVSCKDDFTEEDLVKQQETARKTISGSDSLKFLMAMTEFEYKKYIDSLRRADSLALVANNRTYLPYTYGVQVFDGSNSTQNGGRADAFGGDVVVTISQYGVKQTATARDGLYTFRNIGVGVIHGTITASGYTTFEWTVDVTLPYQFFKESTAAIAAGTGGAGASGGVGGNGGPGLWYLNNPYALRELLKYYNQRSFGNSFTIFSTTGPNTNTVTGRAFIETNLTNRTKEVVPTGTTLSASIDLSNSGPSATFISRYIQTASNLVGPNPPSTGATEPLPLVNGVFNPRKYAYTFLGTAATDASGDFSIVLPSTPDGLMPIKFEYSDVVANKTFYIESNGDVTAITRRNVYGQGIAQSPLPTISTAPTVSFFAGGGATAIAKISGDGSVTDIDVTAVGQDFQGVPRVYITPPPAGGTQATATATVANGKISGITLVNGGSGYTSAPAITITEGSGAAATVQPLALYSDNRSGVANVVVNTSGTATTVPNVVFWYDINGNSVFNNNEALTLANFPNGVSAGGFQTSGTNYPAATASLNSSGIGVASVNVTNLGSGLASSPNVLITTGINATGTVTITGGVVTAVSVTAGGVYYTSAPTISIGGAPGTPTTPAVLTATVTSGSVSGIAITAAGAGYTNGTYPLIIRNNAEGNGGSGADATGTAVWQGLAVFGVNLTNPGAAQVDGRYYQTVPRLIFSEPEFKGAGSKRAEAVATLGQDGRVIGINVTDRGFGYYNVPTLSFVSGTGAAATAKFANVGVTEIEVTGGGSGYIVAPAVLVVDPSKAGSGATATAKITNGVVTTITLTNAGSGYINGAAVIILDPGTTYQTGAATSNAANSGRVPNVAQGNVIVVNGGVSAVEMYRAGDNYPAGTEVRFASTRGTGATATSTVAAGRITAVTVSSGGSQYTGNNYYIALGGAIDPNVALGSSPTAGLSFLSEIPGTYLSKSGVRKVLDLHYGTGANKD